MHNEIELQTLLMSITFLCLSPYYIPSARCLYRNRCSCFCLRKAKSGYTGSKNHYHFLSYIVVHFMRYGVNYDHSWIYYGKTTYAQVVGGMVIYQIRNDQLVTINSYSTTRSAIISIYKLIKY